MRRRKMFLKRLETIGFKSFAERVTIEFVPGITTIVGPNGSGKSNIIDAIRWVLGEQSARTLRGHRMEDIIFQGSDTRNPLNFAEVSLILNNENNELPIDYQEVKVTRRVYRSGESEFLINKQACRLKDIVDLFTDTGLGRESFSIIGQGKIDEILSSKADERRAVFEEAAGVMRYKKRKEEAAYKLTETEDNLSRVDDIIYEISQQMEPLKRQAEVAKQYKQLQGKLRTKEIRLLITEIDQLHKEWQDLLQEIEAEKLKQVKKQTEINQYEAKIVAKREQIEEVEQRVTQLQNDLVTLTEQIEQNEGKRNLLIEQEKHRQANKINLQKEQETIMAESKELKKRLAQEEENIQTIVEQRKNLVQQMEAIKRKLFTRQDELDEEIETLKAEYIDLLNDQAVLKNEQEGLQQRSLQLDQSLGNHETSNATLEKDFEHIQKTRREMMEARQDLEQSLQKEKALLQNLQASLRKETKEIEAEQSKWYQLNEEITKLASRREMLVEMKKNYQGFASGAKEILQANQRGELTDIIGPVIDLIEVPSDYMTAIDTILASQAQHIVVPNDEVARKTIEWLKKENKGRATFLPLQSITARYLPSKVRELLDQENGLIGVASELVTVDSKFRQVADHLMGNVIVTETLKDANRIAAKTNRRYRIVTLDGDIVFPGGSISGGAKRKRQFSLFTREKEIETLSKELDRYHKKRANVRERGSALRHSVNEKNKQMESSESNIKELEEELQALLSNSNELEVKLQSIKSQLDAYRYRQDEYNEEKMKIKQSIETTKDKFSHLRKEIKRVEDLIYNKTKEKELLETERQKHERKLHELQVQNAELTERHKNSQERLLNLENNYETVKEKRREIEEDLKEIALIEASGIEASQLEGKVAQLKTERKKVQESILNLQSLRQKMSQEIEDLSRELRSQQQVHEQHITYLQEKEVKASRLDVTLENSLQLLQDEYTITYEKAAEIYEKVTHVSKVTDQVNELKNKIRALGTVNLGAIEEYERLKERETFLNEQRDDLLEAKNTLYKAIQQMDEEMIARFKSTFESIQAAFSLVFKQLFGGGNAQLVLTDPNDYLETGIDIIARPPGKKLKTLELLSGGERSLTAIALLFAILRARPVPFVILDEVDAALDEANVERFASYLKTFSEDSQFIVISHRKGTMEVADALYGVTMQESGVSRFVSVRLEEADRLVSS